MFRIGIISTTKDLHARKWAIALAHAQCQVFFFCPAPEVDVIPNVTMIPIPGRHTHSWRYVDFILSARRLKREALLHPCHIYISLHATPFGVWSNWANLPNHMIMALGADIFEYTEKIHASARWSAENTLPSWYRKLSRYWHAFQVKKALSRADFVWADNKTLQLAIQKWLPTIQCHVFTWGIDTLFFTPAQALDEKRKLRENLGIPEDAIVIFSGRGFKPIYHPETILHAAKKLNDAPMYWIFLKGNYAVPKGELQSAETSKYNNACFIFELVSAEKLRDYYQVSDIMVSLPEYDGMSASVLEALASGLYPVLSHARGNQELQTDGVSLALCDPNNAMELIHHIEKWKNLYYNSKNDYANKNRRWVCIHADLATQTQKFIQWLGSSGIS